jgi:membrane protein YdbS with pleckstrin-like domain
MTTKDYDIDLSNPNTTEERAKAIATLVIVCAVNVLNVLGYAVDAAPWINVATSIISALAIVWAWWKNQNVTDAAAQAQILLDALKAEGKAAKHAAKAA